MAARNEAALAEQRYEADPTPENEAAMQAAFEKANALMEEGEHSGGGEEDSRGRQNQMEPDRGSDGEAGGTGTVKVNVGQQEKHITGTNNYNQGVNRGINRSILSEDAQGLLDEFAGKGQKIGTNKERVNFGKVIGQYYDASIGKYVDTTNGIIHYDANGTAHIVPARP